jgi:hypothetical protein
MEIEATFIGENSLGYEKGKKYLLKILFRPSIGISRMDGSGVCTYQSLKSFMLNWNYVVHV